MVIFDDRSSLGLVRLRVRKVGEELRDVSEHMEQRSGGPEGGGLLLSSITDEDIDSYNFV